MQRCYFSPFVSFSDFQDFGLLFAKVTKLNIVAMGSDDIIDNFISIVISNN